ncbi:predicted protein [Botrytis cinerea T4]|uniref:Uncharacterized protein n=1 Tax=Botryotinia fuckeliana (strain T4) TaxID=999810 RepID=G2YGR2_BOTF4|nr:predicted protein [Botrytis cinerea T4]
MPPVWHGVYIQMKVMLGKENYNDQETSHSSTTL